MPDTSFARSEMLPPQTPPISERGLVKWLRENLFSSVLNAILTLLGLLVVVYLGSKAVPWFLNGVWVAESLQECRDIVAASAGPDASGACWAMVRERWHQFLFGFYPSDLYWRPVLAMGLLLISLAPVLYYGLRRPNIILVGTVSVLTFIVLALLDKSGTHLMIFALILAGLSALAWFAPKRLLILTITFPLIGFWLLWGGSVWAIIGLALALAVGFGFALLYRRLHNRLLRGVYGLLVAAGAAVVAATLVHYLDGVTSDFLTKMSTTSFYPGFGAESGPIFKAIGAVLSALVWAVSMLLWVVVAVMRWVSWGLNLNLGQYMDFTGAGYLGVGALLAAIAGFSAALSGALAIGMVGGLLAIGAWASFANPWLIGKLEAAMPLSIPSVGSDEFGGFLLAFVIGVTAIGASLPIGILLALGRRSDMLLIKTLCVGFIEFVRGVPLITVLFTATLLLGYFLPPQSNFDVVLRVIILVTFFAAAYMAEVIRGGLAALPRGQYEAADALGLDYWQAQRLIIMPQALKVSIPGIVSSFIGLFKDTTLVAFVGLMDPLKGVTTIVRADSNWKGIYWEPYILVGAIFFAVCFGMSRYSMYLERKLKTDHR